MSTTAWGAASQMRARSVDGDELPGRIVRRVEKDHPRAGRHRVDDRLRRKREVGPRRHPHRLGSHGHRRVGVRIEGGLRNDRFRVVHARLGNVPDRGHEDALVQPVREQHPVGIHTEVPCRGVDRLAVLRIGGDVARADVANGFEHASRAAARVLVQVQPQSLAGAGISL